MLPIVARLPIVALLLIVKFVNVKGLPSVNTFEPPTLNTPLVTARAVLAIEIVLPLMYSVFHCCPTVPS